MDQNTAINASICLSDIPKDKIVKHKNGKLYLNVDIRPRKEVNEYKEDCFMIVRQTKEEKAAKEKPRYLGNGRTIVFKGESVNPADLENASVISPDEVLPF